MNTAKKIPACLERDDIFNANCLLIWTKRLFFRSFKNTDLYRSMTPNIQPNLQAFFLIGLSGFTDLTKFGPNSVQLNIRACAHGATHVDITTHLYRTFTKPEKLLQNINYFCIFTCIRAEVKGERKRGLL